MSGKRELLKPHGASRAGSRDELRESFFRLLQRSFLMAHKQGSGLDVYWHCAGMVRQLCGEQWAQHTIFREETALVRRFLSETALPVRNPDAVIQHSLMGNPWARTWFSALQVLSPDEFAKICHVTGVEHLRAAQGNGRGIVLAHSHTLFIQLFWVWLRHQGIAPGISIWQWAWGRKVDEIRDPKTRVVESARELHAAFDTLRRGGLVQIVADGDKGTQHITLPFCNRRRPFRTTFADLAVATNSQVIPVTARLSIDGRIHIAFDTPLVDDAPPGSGPERVHRLVSQYADRLLELWRTSPGDISWYQMRQHLALPVMSNAG